MVLINNVNTFLILNLKKNSHCSKSLRFPYEFTYGLFHFTLILYNSRISSSISLHLSHRNWIMAFFYLFTIIKEI